MTNENTDTLDAILVYVAQPRTFSFGAPRQEPLGLLYLATYAREKGYRARVYAPSSSILDGIHGRIRETGARVVGFYCDHDNASSVCRVSKVLKEQAPDLILMGGGPQAGPEPDALMENGRFDVLVRGEGEGAFVELLQFYLGGAGTLSDVLGISYRDGERVVHNPDRPPNTQLDDLPYPDRTLSDENAVPRGVERIISGRGCPYSCAFCAEGTHQSVYRYRSTGVVLDEVDYLIEQREFRYLLFMDDTFVAAPARAMEIAAGLKERRDRGADFRWFCEARVDILCRHPELLPAMKEAGLARVQIGIESGNQEVIDAYGKRITLEQIREGVQLIVDAGIPSIAGNFIIGGALESPDTVARTIDFAEELINLAPGRMDLTTTYLTPYPGTAIRHQPEAYGLRLIDPECLKGEDDRYCFVETSGLTKWDIIDAHERFLAVRDGTMRKALVENRIPEEVMLEHVVLFKKYDLITNWAQLYFSIEHIAGFVGLLWSGDCLRSREVPAQDLPDLYPVRTARIGASHEGKLVLETLGEPLKLDALGTAIYEYCSGRSSLRRIGAMIKEDFFPAEPEVHVYALVLSFLKQLEAKRLVVWSRI